MSYQVLARKWRPRTFHEMVGQEHVLKALINALDHDRLHHAYLFTGTRGVGKTTIARILAKCLNCETSISSEPCGECSACSEITDGRYIDLIEVDAASRTKVEDTRELLDNVLYAPTRGRYKIYLIDEVHMLSNHSFNALLKTLEEPPEHVKFLLATTDPQKLPVTILSRCLQFNLKNLSPERIVTHLKHVLSQEVILFEEAALWQLARSVDGSMRDALSLTDQAISFGNGKVLEEDVDSMMGTIDHKMIEEIICALIDADGKRILQAVANFADHAPDYDNALADLLTVLHRIAIAQALPEALDNSYGDRHQILEFARQIAAEDVQLFYQTALIGRRDLALASDPRSGFEMTLLRMLAFKPHGIADIPQRALEGKTRDAKPQEDKTAKKPQSEPRAEDARTADHSMDSSKKIDGDDVRQPNPEQRPVPPLPEQDLAADSIATKIATNATKISRTEELAEPASAEINQTGPELTVSSSNTMAMDSKVAERSDTSLSPIPLENFSPQDWVAVHHQMNIKGIVQSTAANCVMLGREENTIFLLLDQDKTSLYDASHERRLADCLSDYFGQAVKVTIQLSQLPEATETPAIHDERIRKMRHADALHTLKNDPVVQTLEKEFDAVLLEDTVKYPN